MKCVQAAETTWAGADAPTNTVGALIQAFVQAIYFDLRFIEHRGILNSPNAKCHASVIHHLLV